MPTRAGWSAALAAAVAFVAGRVFGLVELYMAGTALVTALVVALVSVSRGGRTLTADRVAEPPVAEVGDEARAALTVQNRSVWRTPVLRLWDAVGDDAGVPMRLAPLRRGRHATATYRIPTNQRGIVELGPLRVERTDLLGLARRSAFVGSSSEVVVLPRIVALDFPSLVSSGVIGASLRRRAWAVSGTEFHAHREYVPGDDLRTINWKASARMGDLMVRETERPGLRHCTVVLDRRAAVFTNDSFEVAVSIAASLVNAAQTARTPVHFLADGADLRGVDVAATASRWLATVARGGAAVPTITRAADGLAVVVAVSGSDDFLASVKAQCGPDDTFAGLRVDADNTLEHMSDLWNGLVRR